MCIFAQKRQPLLNAGKDRCLTFKFALLSHLRVVCVVSLIFNFELSLHLTPLSGDDIWIKVLPQKRHTVHIDGCDILNDLRPFLKYLVGPFSSKLRSKEAKGLKSGNLGKQNFFLNINFLLYSILFLYIMVNFQLQVG